jgi:hypothetical protein
MELDLQSLFGLLCTAVLTVPPPPAFGLIYEGDIVCNPRRNMYLLRMKSRVLYGL